MPGKRVQFDDETWEAILAVARSKGRSFEELADEAFSDLLKKHKQPVGLKAALKESVGKGGRGISPLNLRLRGYVTGLAVLGD